VITWPMLAEYLVHSDPRSAAEFAAASPRVGFSKRAALEVVVVLLGANAATDWQSMGVGGSGALVSHVPLAGYQRSLP
jgi:hypothetical protein